MTNKLEEMCDTERATGTACARVDEIKRFHHFMIIALMRHAGLTEVHISTARLNELMGSVPLSFNVTNTSETGLRIEVKEVPWELMGPAANEVPL